MKGLTDNIRLLIEWAPILQIFSAIASSKPGSERVIQVARLAEFMTTKTENKVDDQLVRLLTAILLTPQADALVQYLTELVEKASEKTNEPDGLSGT